MGENVTEGEDQNDLDEQTAECVAGRFNLGLAVFVVVDELADGQHHRDHKEEGSSHGINRDAA